jgi:hypothetical protein
MQAVNLDAPEHEHEYSLAGATVLGCTWLAWRGCRGG